MALSEDYSTKKLQMGPVGITIDSSSTVQEIFALQDALKDDKDFTARQSLTMLEFVRENIRSGQRAVKAETLKRRKYAMNDRTSPRGPVSSTAPLISSGALLNHIEARSGRGYASVRRGKNEWYGFLHDLGVGRLDERSFMSMTSGQVEQLYSERESWVDEVLAR